MKIKAEGVAASSDFECVANTGARMYFPDVGDVVINLDGIAALHNDKPVPILWAHKESEPLGYCDSISVSDNIVMAGKLTIPCDKAEEVRVSARENQPWQMSLGFEIIDSTVVGAGDEVSINGRTETGPLTIANAIEIYEVSVVTFGADDRTSIIRANATLDTVESSDAPEAAQEPESDAIEAENEQSIVEDTIGAGTVSESVSEEVAEIADVETTESEEDTVVDNEEQVEDAPAVEEPAVDAVNIKQASKHTVTDLCCNIISTSKEMKMEENTKLNASRVATAAILMASGSQFAEGRFKSNELEAAQDIYKNDLRTIVEATTGFVPTHTERNDAKAWCKAASSYGFGEIISNIASEKLNQFYAVTDKPWEKIMKVTTLPDTRPAVRYRINTSMEYTENKVGEEFENGTYGDVQYILQAKIYGKQVTVPYEDILAGNGVGAVNDVTRQLAWGCQQAIKRQVWGKFLNPGNAIDGTAFYHANHKNLVASRALNFDNLCKAKADFVKCNGLGIAPKYLVVPSELANLATMLVKSTTMYQSSNGGTNPLYGSLEVVEVPELSRADYTGYSDSTWYVVGDPNVLPAFEVGFVGGFSDAIIRSEECSVGRLGIMLDGHIGLGVIAEDERGSVKYTA